MASRPRILIEKTQICKILLDQEKIYNCFWCFIFDTDSEEMKEALKNLAKTQSTIKYLSYAVTNLGIDGKVIIGVLQLTGKLKKMTILERFPLFMSAILGERRGDQEWQKIAQVWVKGGHYWDLFQKARGGEAPAVELFNTDFWEFKERCLKRGRPAKPSKPVYETDTVLDLMQTLSLV